MSDRQFVLEAVSETPKTGSLREFADELQIVTVRERVEGNPKAKGASAGRLLRQVSLGFTL